MICDVEIYDKDDGCIELILCEPKGIDYKGVSTTNHFEFFATKIKKELFPEVSHEKIFWKDRHEFRNPQAFPTKELKVAMDFDGANYSNPRWYGGVRV